MKLSVVEVSWGMFRFSILFWCAVVASFAWGGSILVGLKVSEFYHPMAVRGDLFVPLRYGAIALPVLVAVGMLGFWLGPRRLSPRYYQGGLTVLAIAACFPFLPRVDSGYHQSYWLGENRHEIPWQYSPYNGSPEPGGKYFLVKVSVPDLVPRYETREKTVIIGKAVDFIHGKGGPARVEPCRRQFSSMSCEWQRGDNVYSASGNVELFPSDMPVFMVSVAELLDGFEVPAL